MANRTSYPAPLAANSRTDGVSVRISGDDQVRAKLAKILDKVIGKRIVVINH